MATKTGKVTQAEAAHLGVAEYLSSMGVRARLFTENSAHHDACLGFRLLSSRAVSTTFFGFTRTKHVRLMTGYIWLKRPSAGATEKNWVIHVYGREFVDDHLQIAHRLAEKFGVDVHVRLEQVEATEF